MSVFGLIRGFRSSDSTAQPLRLDKATNTIQTIDYAHHEIHAGSAFTCHFSQTSPTAVGEMTMIAFNTKATAPYVHMLAEFSSTAASIAAMERLEAEESHQNDADIIDEESLDPSERMGSTAVISTGDEAKKVEMVNSILPESDSIKNRDPFLNNGKDSDESADDVFLDDVDASGDDDSFIE